MNRNNKKTTKTRSISIESQPKKIVIVVVVVVVYVVLIVHVVAVVIAVVDPNNLPTLMTPSLGWTQIFGCFECVLNPLPYQLLPKFGYL